jgi:hypothetical protein
MSVADASISHALALTGVGLLTLLQLRIVADMMSSGPCRGGGAAASTPG